MAVMRTSLWPGLLSSMTHNLNRQHNRVRLFETGLRFIPDGEGLPKQDRNPGLVLVTGRRDPESWSENGETVDFYDIKGDLESVLALGGNSTAFSFVRGEHPALHPGQTAQILSIMVQDVGLCGHHPPRTPEKARFCPANVPF